MPLGKGSSGNRMKVKLQNTVWPHVVDVVNSDDEPLFSFIFRQDWGQNTLTMENASKKPLRINPLSIKESDRSTIIVDRDEIIWEK